MIRTIEAMIDENGVIHPSEPLPSGQQTRVLVTILDEESVNYPNTEALLSEHALAEDWNKPEEEMAWSHLLPAQ